MKAINTIKAYISSYRLIIIILIATLILFNPTAISPILLPIMMALEILIKSIITHLIHIFQHHGSETVKQILTSIWK